MKIKTLSFTAVLGIGLLSLMSCEKDEGKVPNLSFKYGTGYTSADATLPKGSAYKIGIEASKLGTVFRDPVNTNQFYFAKSNYNGTTSCEISRPLNLTIYTVGNKETTYSVSTLSNSLIPVKKFLVQSLNHYSFRPCELIPCPTCKTGKATSSSERINATENSNLQTLTSALIYPNPAKGVVIIETESPVDCTIEIYNMLGEKVVTTEHSGNRTLLDLSYLPKGVYMLNLVSDRETICKKVILE